MRPILKKMLLIVCMMTFIPSHAQFFKKLGKKISDAAENTVTRKSANKTSDEVGKGMDGIFSGMKGKKGKHAVSAPDHIYAFDYHYKMKMSTEDHSMMMDYYFKPSRDYTGVAMNQMGKKKGMKMFLIFDYGKAATYSFMSSAGRKMYTSTALDLDTANDWANNEYTKTDYTVTELPNKTFLGYSCKGRQIENDEWKFTMYYTNEIEVSFQDILRASKQSKNPSVLRKYFKDAEDGLMLYMRSIDKQHRNLKVVTMECVEFDKKPHDFKTKNYQPMGF